MGWRESAAYELHWEHRIRLDTEELATMTSYMTSNGTPINFTGDRSSDSVVPLGMGDYILSNIEVKPGVITVKRSEMISESWMTELIYGPDTPTKIRMSLRSHPPRLPGRQIYSSPWAMQKRDVL